MAERENGGKDYEVSFEKCFKVLKKMSLFNVQFFFLSLSVPEAVVGLEPLIVGK
jgi:hypothetical protein